MSRVSGTDFGTVASAYQRGRPGYPARSVSWLLGGAEEVAGTGGGAAEVAGTGGGAEVTNGIRDAHPAEVIADIGAGTGKLTQSLVGSGRRVIAVDPDERMLAALSAQLPDVETRRGRGEALPLEDASVDLLAFGQSWHWVDPECACAEAARALRPGGALGLIWNIRDETVDWVAELTEIIAPSTAEAYVAKLLGSPNGSPLTEVFQAPEVHREEWSRPLTVDQLVDMVASRSATIAASENDRARMLERVRDLGERVSSGAARLELPYVTHAFRAEPRS